MQIFIQDVLQDLEKNSVNFANCVFILPSKRAGVFLKSNLHHYLKETSFAPDIISIEDFVQELSELKQISGIELLFQFYSTYKKITPVNSTEPFETFSKWAQILIQDFNEVDRYLVPPNEIFDYLSAIQEINHWSLENQKTELINNYLRFWGNLKAYYHQLTNDLISQNIAYQGLIYKEATKHIESYAQNNFKTHIFLGFNALNSCESEIIQTLLKHDKAKIYWDLDSHYYNDTMHSAGRFARKYKEHWNHYQKHPFNWIGKNYSKPKQIKAIGCPKSIGQSKYIGQLLKNISDHNPDLNNTAVVLGDETLLTPVLNSLPATVESVNVTMGLPLKDVPLNALFIQLFNLHRLNSHKFYYKEVIAILSDPMVNYLLKSSQHIINTIQENNHVYLSVSDILKFGDAKDEAILKLLFGNWDVSISEIIKVCNKLIQNLRVALSEDKLKKQLELEYLYRFNTLFNELSTLNSKYNYIKDVSTLYAVYKELLNTETLDFKGEPLEGLQIMGMLESRVLDFETVIISSVNEGILPGGKTNNSFIPFDVKIDNGLPTFKEKDAVYTYHFYNLIQRAKHIYLIYNTEVDTLKGGEKSRFITQLEVDGVHDIKHVVASPKIPQVEENLIEIKKDESVITQLKLVAEKGFSPSSLTNYIRNPIDFYLEKVLGVKDSEDVEETVAANTLGTVIHNTLEDFYKTFEGHYLSVEDLIKMKSLITKTVSLHFKEEYKEGDIATGKNLIIYEIAKRYVTNFIDSEIELLQSGNTLKIIAIEVDNLIPISLRELDFPIKLKGKVDRVDELNGIVRVIDYKSGKVEQNQVEIFDWGLLTTDYKKYSKSFQVLCYVYMMQKQGLIHLPVEAGIISFKNLKQGFLKFGLKPSFSSRTKEQLITETILQDFEMQLKKLILEICNPEIHFKEKEID
ncbi:PD-(D/E)XK nuclease superfamily protein [Winogradskyella wandonensis]|uniref:PD-(D/E)XK nuclease superfamily protein n=1 Tax=Winogradskyella wandonensis TaxID=1442586 RepID=A0A4R1KTT0_9FLAO|nr:PD-(D/E)XK nuclease family protein [Winogradskyella wandonensis]TCK67933.1 PD-(D/E)XK nuclease superfamily protein [Winogradskyella wandonensis]